MRRLGAAILASAALAGCASTEYKMVPADTVGASVRFDRGIAAMVSEGHLGTVMVIPPRYNAKRKLALWVSAYNRSGSPVNFGSEDISIRLDDGPAVPAQDFDYLRMEAQHDAQRELVAAWIVAGLQEVAAAYIARRNPELAHEVHRWNIHELQHNQALIRQNLWETILRNYKAVLKTTTIDPGAQFGGGVISDQIALPKHSIHTMEIIVHFAGEDHSFLMHMAPGDTHLSVQPDIPATTRAKTERQFTAPRTWLWTTDPPGPRIIE